MNFDLPFFFLQVYEYAISLSNEEHHIPVMQVSYFIAVECRELRGAGQGSFCLIGFDILILCCPHSVLLLCALSKI